MCVSAFFCQTDHRIQFLLRVVAVLARLQVLLHMVEQSALAYFQSRALSRDPYSSLVKYKFKVWELNLYLTRPVV